MSIEYTNILNLHNIERNYCKCCGNDITYYDTRAWVDKHNVVKTSGKTWKTTKHINDKIYELSICQECLLKKFKIKNLSRVFNVLSEPTKYAFNIPDDIAKQWVNQNTAMTFKNMIKKYGDEEGTKRWNNYCNRQRLTNEFEYKKEKHGWSADKFDSFNKSRAVTLENMIKKYGDEEGTKRWNNYCNRQRLTKSWSYMVEKYGKEKAYKINKSKGITLENMINRYGDEGITKYNEAITHVNSGVSAISQKIFEKLDEYISPKYETYYANKNFEFAIQVNDKYYKLDYYIPELKIAIEYNGSIFHADKRLYGDECKCNPWSNKTAKEIREYDNVRLENIKSNGIKVFIIWELDFDKNFDYVNYIKNTLKIDIDD